MPQNKADKHERTKSNGARRHLPGRLRPWFTKLNGSDDGASFERDARQFLADMDTHVYQGFLDYRVSQPVCESNNPFASDDSFDNEVRDVVSAISNYLKASKNFEKGTHQFAQI